MRFAIATAAVFAMVGCTTEQPVPEAPKYKTVLVGSTWQRVNLETGDVCMTDLTIGQWVCTEQLNMLMELQALEAELASEPEWFNDPTVKRDGA